MKQLIECVPNISEGRDLAKINAIANVVTTVEGIKLLNVDPGAATNRTVITFVGEPDAVIEAAFLLIKKAAELIDMSKHQGEHPRFGATDVCPLIPIANISMEDVVPYAHKLGARVGKELDIPGYFYEYACTEEKRRNLANCRAGEYEGLPKKLTDPAWKPDFGPATFTDSVKSTGAIAISARDFLIAYNINLNTTSVRRANSLAFDLRENGRVLREGDPVTGKEVKDANGNPVREPGALKAVKGIGWFIEEYGIAQVSLNLTNLTVTPMHIAFDTACNKAWERGLRVTGSELVGLVPLEAMLDAGRFFLKKQQRSVGVSESELIKIAIRSLGLDELTPFDPKQRIIEYMIADDASKRLVDMSLTAFADETASESPAPGGGSIAAYVGALGISLGTMVANLSSHKRGWDDRWEEFSDHAERGQAMKEELLRLVDEDTAAFNGIMAAFALPKATEAEKAARTAAIQDATKQAILIPLKVMQAAHASMTTLKAMAEVGNPNSVSDAGVGALCARSAVMGAHLNVRINAGGLHDKAFLETTLATAKQLEEEAITMEKEILLLVEGKL
jgi:glutamate formiminotransferase/formiminotetrahydrofolate cyclodeaminase